MNADRIIKVVRCGCTLISGYHDRISIEFSPDELLQLEKIFIHRALNAETYVQQDFEREMKNTYNSARELWLEERAKR